jgi:hypothetical protein
MRAFVITSVLLTFWFGAATSAWSQSRNLKNGRVDISDDPALDARTGTAMHEKRPFPIDVRHTGDDSVGGRIAFEVKEVIAKSAILRRVEGSLPHYELLLVSTGDTSNSAVSYVLVERRYASLDGRRGLGTYISSGVAQCGASRVESCARSIVAETANNIEKWVRP